MTDMLISLASQVCQVTLESSNFVGDMVERTKHSRNEKEMLKGREQGTQTKFSYFKVWFTDYSPPILNLQGQSKAEDRAKC